MAGAGGAGRDLPWDRAGIHDRSRSQDGVPIRLLLEGSWGRARSTLHLEAPIGGGLRDIIHLVGRAKRLLVGGGGVVRSRWVPGAGIWRARAVVAAVVSRPGTTMERCGRSCGAAGALRSAWLGWRSGRISWVWRVLRAAPGAVLV